jgi:hypothetical protein
MSERRLLTDEELADIAMKVKRLNTTYLDNKSLLAHIEALTGLLADMQLDSLAYREGVMAGRIERNAEVVAELRDTQNRCDFMKSYTAQSAIDFGQGYLTALDDAIHNIEEE